MIEILSERCANLYGHAPSVVARAPGRIEFIGNHTDYNGGCVIGASIDRNVWVGVARRPGGERRFASDARPVHVVLPVGAFDRQDGERPRQFRGFTIR